MPFARYAAWEMMVFWWQGKGYWTVLIALIVACAFGILLQASRAIVPDRPWLWGIALLIIAAINWPVGCRYNAKKRASPRNATLRGRLFYPARHRFMSLPMENWSAIFAIAGLAVIGFDLSRPA